MENVARGHIEAGFGIVSIMATVSGICRVDLVKVAPPALASDSDDLRAREMLKRASEEIKEFLKCERVNFSVPLDLKVGTPFQWRVWRAVRTIPRGQTCSYSEIAQAVNCRSSRAVGGAIGKNPVALLIPCHRVVGRNGSLGGFAWGDQVKEQLLHLERRCIKPPLSSP